MKFLIYLLVITTSIFSPLFADTVTILKTIEKIDNVKTSAASKTEINVEFKDGSKQKFKNSQVTVVSSDVVWEEPKPIEKPGFFKRLFGSKNAEEKRAENVTVANDTSPPTQVSPSVTDATAESGKIPLPGGKLGTILLSTFAVLLVLIP